MSPTRWGDAEWQRSRSMLAKSRKVRAAARRRLRDPAVAAAAAAQAERVRRDRQAAAAAKAEDYERRLRDQAAQSVERVRRRRKDAAAAEAEDYEWRLRDQAAQVDERARRDRKAAAAAKGRSELGELLDLVGESREQHPGDRPHALRSVLGADCTVSPAADDEPEATSDAMVTQFEVRAWGRRVGYSRAPRRQSRIERAYLRLATQRPPRRWPEYVPYLYDPLRTMAGRMTP